MNIRKQTMFPGRLFNQLGGDDQIYMQNLAHSLFFIQNSRGLDVEKQGTEAVIIVKSAREHDIKPEFVRQNDNGL